MKTEKKAPKGQEQKVQTVQKASTIQKKEVSKIPKEKESETPVQENNLLDRVIANMTEDKKALDEQNKLIENAKSYKQEIVNRIRESRKDLLIFVKYATPKQLERLNTLNIDLEETGQGPSKLAQLVMDILEKTPKGEMTNDELHIAYVKSFKNENEASNYSAFNIKCRSLFNSQKLIRIEPKDAKSSRDHIISINGFIPQN